jgi:hypothetical protein
MGSFCEQYGATPLRAPSKSKNKKPASKGRNNFRYHKKQFYKDKPEFYKKPYKKNYGKKPYRKYNNKSKPKDKDVKCYKYGRFGHYANKCKVQEKINQLSNLDISEELKESLITTLNNILLNSEEEGSSTSEESSYEEIHQIDNSEKTDDDSDECLGLDFCNCDNCNKIINVLTNNQANTLIGILDKMENSESKNAFMRQIKNIIDENDISKKNIHKVEFKNVMDLFKKPVEKTVSIKDLQEEISNLKNEIRILKTRDDEIEIKLLELQGNMIIQNQSNKNLASSSLTKNNEETIILNNEDGHINKIEKLISHKWYSKINLIVKDKTYELIALIDSGADLNCIQEGLIPTQYYEKTKESLRGANGNRLQVSYKLSSAKICKDQICYKTFFLLVRNIHESIILGTPFLALLYPFTVNNAAITTNALGREIKFEFSEPPKIRDLNSIQSKVISFINQINNKRKQINFINKEIHYKKIEDQLQSPSIQEKN